MCRRLIRFPAKFNSENNPTGEKDICAQCQNQLELGKQLTHAEFVSFFADNTGKIKCGGLSASIGDAPQAGAFHIVRFNNPDLLPANRFPASFRYLTNYVPRDDDRNPWTFESIAAERFISDSDIDEDRGRRALLGILKADVDYLGLIFQEGLRRDAPAQGLDSITRISALSRQLEWFFSGWLEWKLRTEYDGCYAVYSGGDDLLLIGPRGRMLTMAGNIQRIFQTYTRNPAITLSAGLAIVKSRLPLAHTVAEADAALEQAKNNGRDSLCFLNDPMKWQEFSSISVEIQRLSRLVAMRDEGRRVPSGFLYELLQAAEMRKAYKEKDDLLALRYHPRLAYQIARNIDPDRQRELFEWATRLLQLPESVETQHLWQHLRLITQWALLERRES